MANRIARRARKRDKIRTAKLLDKITYNPLVHKQKVKRKLRQELQARLVDSQADSQDYQSYRNMKFGSINVNGLEIDANWAIRNIIDQRGFDVGSSFSLTIEHLGDYYHKCIWMRSLGGAAMANDALITQSSTMKRLFCPNNSPFFALISINLELQGGPVAPRPPTKYVYIPLRELLDQIRFWCQTTIKH